MKEKYIEKSHKKKSKKHKKEKKKSKRPKSRSDSSSSSNDEWVEKNASEPQPKHPSDRDDWMSMTGIIPTYSREAIKVERKNDKEKKNIDDYNPGTCARELNPYWKDGGSGLPSTKPAFIKPTDERYGYFRNNKDRDYKRSDKDYYSSRSESSSSSYVPNWKKKPSEPRQCSPTRKERSPSPVLQSSRHEDLSPNSKDTKPEIKKYDDKYLSDEKMNQLAAKIVKAEIMGDEKLVTKLNLKLSAAREYRKQNPDAGKVAKQDDIMLTITDGQGNTRPLSKSATAGDPRSKSGKRKAGTHAGRDRLKHFANDDKYTLSEMFQKEKYGTGYDEEEQLAKVAAKHTNPNDDLEDIFSEEISRVQDEGREDEKNKRRAIDQHVKREKSIEGCERCIDSKNMLRHMMVSCGSKAYVALPARKSLTDNHCIITTIHHTASATALDEDVWSEILNYRRCLTQMFNSRNEDVVFFETATRLHKFPHMVIHCVPMPRDVGDTAPIYFKKALLECEAEWSVNKKVVDLKGKDIRRGIPKGLPYFWVDFGMEPGFAHVIEDQQLFPDNFAQEIIGGILDLDHSVWRRPSKEKTEEQRKKVVEFVKEWKKFDTINQKIPNT